jgi:hypothetical protein
MYCLTKNFSIRFCFSNFQNAYGLVPKSENWGKNISVERSRRKNEIKLCNPEETKLFMPVLVPLLAASCVTDAGGVYPATP